MNGMISLAIALLITQTDPYDAAFSARLVKWRTQFEEVLEEPSGDIGYTHIYYETLGPAHSEILYPIGSASERFVIDANEGPYQLIFESRHGKKALVDWYLPIVKVARKSKAVKGTIANYLMRQGYAIAPRRKLSAAIRKRLEANDALASFIYHPMQGGYAWIVKPDGTTMKTHQSEDSYSILPEEADLLRKRAKRS